MRKRLLDLHGVDLSTPPDAPPGGDRGMALTTDFPARFPASLPRAGCGSGDVNAVRLNGARVSPLLPSPKRYRASGRSRFRRAAASRVTVRDVGLTEPRRACAPCAQAR
jgi:hypothetical protein